MWHSQCSPSVTMGMEWGPGSLEGWVCVPHPLCVPRLCPARSAAAAAEPRAAQAAPRCSSGSPVSLDSTTPGLLADCSQLFTQWERALAAHDMSALFSPGYCQVDGEAAGWGESIHNPDMRQRLSGYPHRQVWPVGLSPVSNTLSHLKRAIGTPALNTPACCCSPSGSLLASLKWAGCCFMGAGLCLDRWSRGWAP